VLLIVDEPEKRHRDLDSRLPVYIQTWVKELDHTQFAPYMATLSLGVLGVMFVSFSSAAQANIADTAQFEISMARSLK
jgi:hypothetical protein